jgi:hypothetical protein
MGTVANTRNHLRKKRKPTTDQRRDEAWKRIKAAAREHGVDLSAKDWREPKKAKKR